MSFAQELKTLYRLSLGPIRGKSHGERLESFYADQADHYDISRRRLLHGRRELYRSIPVPADGVWVEMGAGTGANLEHLGPSLQLLRKIFLVDLSASLLRVAETRAKRLGWHSAAVIEDDVTRVTLPEPADVITFSYSLTMIPDWYLALENAYRLLRPGGLIAVVDFYVARKYPEAGLRRHSAWTRWFWPSWFRLDNVCLSPDHLPYLRQHFDTIHLEECLGTMQYFPLCQVPYYLFVGRKRTTSM